MGGTHWVAGTSALLLVLIALAGCGGGSDSGSGSGSGSTAVAPPVTRTLSAAEQARANARAERRARVRLERTFAPNPWREPGTTARHPRGEPRRLIVRDVKLGRGPALTGHEIVYADFVKTFWLSGKKFLVAWGPHRAEYLDLEAQASGIRRGMTGMRPGGRRTIAIPRTIADVHPPDGSAGLVAARMDVVLRTILRRE
jgi:hypothetical protein